MIKKIALLSFFALFFFGIGIRKYLISNLSSSVDSKIFLNEFAPKGTAVVSAPPKRVGAVRIGASSGARAVRGDGLKGSERRRRTEMRREEGPRLRPATIWASGYREGPWQRHCVAGSPASTSMIWSIGASFGPGSIGACSGSWSRRRSASPFPVSSTIPTISGRRSS